MFSVLLASSISANRMIDISSIIIGTWYVNISSSLKQKENPKQYHLQINQMEDKNNLVYNITEFDNLENVISSSHIKIDNYFVDIYDKEDLLLKLKFDVKNNEYLAASGSFNETYIYSTTINNDNALNAIIINQESNEIITIAITRDMLYDNSIKSSPIADKIYSYVFLGVTMAISVFVVKKVSAKIQQKKVLEELKKLEDEEKQNIKED